MDTLSNSKSSTSSTSSNKSNNSNRSSSNSSGSSRNNNKRKTILLDDVNNDYDNNNKVLMVSGGLPWVAMASYLEPRDILNCIQTCQKWKNDIDKDGVWCEVAMIVSPNAVAAIIQQENNIIANTDPTTPELKYRNMAIGLSRKFDDNCNLEFPEPKLQLQDILVVIEFRDKGNNNKHLGAFCSEFSENVSFDPSNDDENSKKDSFSSIILSSELVKQWGKDRREWMAKRREWFAERHALFAEAGIDEDNYDDFNVILPPDIDKYHGDNDPPTNWACNRLEMTSRLIRRDTGRCICINDYRSILDDINEEGRAYFETSDSGLKPKSKTLSGTIARELCYEHNYNYMYFSLDFLMEPISTFEYKIKSFEFQLLVNTGDDDCASGFECTNHFLLYLEGLDWK